MIDTMFFRVNGTEKRLSEMSDVEIEFALDEYHFFDLVNFIKYLAKVVKEQHHIIVGLEDLLHEDMAKEDWDQ